MRLLSFALGGLLLSTALPALAQTSAEAPAAPRFYIGLAAYSSYYQMLGGQPGSKVNVPLQLTAGYQLCPRLAVQASLAYSGRSYSYSNAGQYYTGASPAGAYKQFEGRSTYRNYSVSVLARYTLTRQLSHRMQFDALGGLGLENTTWRSRGIQSDSVQSTLIATTYDNHVSTTIAVLSLGGSARYRISNHLDLAYDLTFNRRVGSNTFHQPEFITSASALGLRYRFGRR